jgi:hypothetical protein
MPVFLYTMTLLSLTLRFLIIFSYANLFTSLVICIFDFVEEKASYNTFKYTQLHSIQAFFVLLLNVCNKLKEYLHFSKLIEEEPVTIRP